MGKRLTFVLKTEGSIKVGMAMAQRFHPNGAINQTEWRGFAPRSCMVTRFGSQPKNVGDTGPTFYEIDVTHRPKGEISYRGEMRLDGWDVTKLARNAEGRVDESGNALEDSKPGVYITSGRFQEIDFNALDFGQLVSESDDIGVPKVTVESIYQEIESSGSGNVSMKSNFVAARRSRPVRKIILSNSPTSEGVDGFGTQILNINMSTPHLEQELMERLTELLFDFLEGRASIKCIECSSVCFVELSDVLVDCEPNEQGMNSWFDMLPFYTPTGFMEELAQRVMAKYRVAVSIVDGRKGGLVLRHDKSSG